MSYADKELACLGNRRWNDGWTERRGIGQEFGDEDGLHSVFSQLTVENGLPYD